MGRLGRATARLVPARRRDWAEAIWAEAAEVPSGFSRLAWLAGGVRVLAREALAARRMGRWLLFAAAAAGAVVVTWPGSLSGFATAGIMLGTVMYTVAPLGLSKNATEPWLAGSAIDPVVALAWILLLAGPVAAGAVAGRRYRSPGSPGSPEQLTHARIWQSTVAGFLATGTGALIVAVLGTGTVALMPSAAWLRHWLYPGQHLLAHIAYRHELAASSSVGGYGLLLITFPVIGLLLGFSGAAAAIESADPPADA
jgi:hypothetical protein